MNDDTHYCTWGLSCEEPAVNFYVDTIVGKIYCRCLEHSILSGSYYVPICATYEEAMLELVKRGL